MDLAEVLRSAGLLDEQKLEMARHAQADGQRLDEAAVELGLITEEQALRAIGEAVGLPFIDLVESEIDLSLLASVPAGVIHHELIFPVRQQNGSLVVATANPFSLYALDELSATLGKPIQSVLAPRSEIAKLIKTHLGVGSQTVDRLVAQSDESSITVVDEGEADGSELSQMAQEPSVVRLVNEILLEALDSRASDVHVESEADSLGVR